MTCTHCHMVFGGTEKLHAVELCPIHSGEMAEKLAEALRFAHGTHRFSYQAEACGICQLLAAYEASK